MNKHSSTMKEFEKQEAMTRRNFARVTLGGVSLCYAAAVGYPIYRYLQAPVEKAELMAAITEVTLKDAQKLPPGSALMFKFGVEPCLLIHHQDTTWVALSARCTHLGCTVQYQPEQGRIHCACHGGVYDPHTGKNISGPPPRPLASYVTKVTDAGVLVTRS